MKTLFTVLLSAVIITIMSGTSFAAGQSSSGGKITLGGTDTVDVTLSANVEANYYSNGGDKYSASTYNSKGTGRAYGVASNSSSLYYNDGQTAPGTLNKGDSQDFSGWKTF